MWNKAFAWFSTDRVPDFFIHALGVPMSDVAVRIDGYMIGGLVGKSRKSVTCNVITHPNNRCRPSPECNGADTQVKGSHHEANQRWLV